VPKIGKRNPAEALTKQSRTEELFTGCLSIYTFQYGLCFLQQSGIFGSHLGCHPTTQFSVKLLHCQVSSHIHVSDLKILESVSLVNL